MLIGDSLQNAVPQTEVKIGETTTLFTELASNNSLGWETPELATSLRSGNAHLMDNQAIIRQANTSITIGEGKTIAESAAMA